METTLTSSSKPTLVTDSPAPDVTLIAFSIKLTIQLLTNDDFKCTGLFVEGARWDINIGSIVESRLKELHPVMPVMYIRAITQDKQELRNLYDCPVYKTRQRGPTYVWTFNLKTKEKPAKWILAGVALLLQI